MAEAQTLTCSRCEASISPDELNAGLSVRVDGQLVCQMCVDTLPGEALVRINQVRALRGMEATTYSVKNDRLPRAQLFSFTTSSNMAHHRRKLASDGFYEAPPLPPPAQRNRLPTPTEVKRIATDRVARGVFPNKLPMLLAGGATIVLLGAIALSMTLASSAKPAAASQLVTQPAEVPARGSVRPLKSRIDYPVDVVQAWTDAAQDSACPALVLQGIAQELIRKRSLQLADAEHALEERRLEDAAAFVDALSVPDDIAFRELRRSENELRDRLLKARTLVSVPKTIPPTPELVEKPQVPVVESLPSPVPTKNAPQTPPPPQATDARLIMWPDDADLGGTGLKTQDTGGRRHIGLWNNAADSARWTVQVATAGRFRAEVVAAAESGPTEVVLEVGQRQLHGKIAATGSWENYSTVPLGVIDLPNAGKVNVRLRPKEPQRWEALHVASITLIPTNEAETATALTPPSIPKPIIKPPAAPITAWSGAFVTGGRDRPPRVVPLNGSEHVPSGLPGGVTMLFRTVKSQALKRHVAFVDLAGANASGGGVVILVHPGRNDRNEILASLTDGKGKTLKFDSINLAGESWTPLVLPLPNDPSFDATSLVTLTLEDAPKSAHIPDDGGFLISKAVVINGKEPTPADLGLRTSALMPDSNRLRNLPRLLDSIAKSRNKNSAQKLIETGRIRFLLGERSDNKEWRIAMRRQLEPHLTGKLPKIIMADFTFTDAWLDAMTKNKDAELDPAAIHMAVLWTGGLEVGTSINSEQVVNRFWNRRLDQIINAGIMPVVVIGPHQLAVDRRNLVDQVWQQLLALPQIRQYGVPVIDLRAVPTADDGSWDPATATMASHLVVDAVGEIIFTLRRLGVVK